MSKGKPASTVKTFATSLNYYSDDNIEKMIQNRYYQSSFSTDNQDIAKFLCDPLNAVYIFRS